jgi:hypothetical protein
MASMPGGKIAVEYAKLMRDGGVAETVKVRTISISVFSLYNSYCSRKLCIME